MAAGTQGRISRGGERLLTPREEFPAAGNLHRNKNGVSGHFRDAVFVVFYTEAFVFTPFHSFTPSLLYSSFTPPLLLPS